MTKNNINSSTKEISNDIFQNDNFISKDITSEKSISIPKNFIAEKGVLGAILLNNQALDRVQEFLEPKHFADIINGKIYKLLLEQIPKGNTLDLVTLHSYFDNDPELKEQANGAEYLSSLLNSVSGIYNVEAYGKSVYEMYLRRQLINLGQQIVENSLDLSPDNEAEQQIEKAEETLYNLATTGEYNKGFKSFDLIVQEALHLAEIAHRRTSSISGVDTGLHRLNELLGGFQNSDLLILAGRPSMGKTALATNIAYNAAKKYHNSQGNEGAVVGFFSLEMSASQLASRIIAEQAEIPSDSLRKGNLKAEEFDRLIETIRIIEEAPLFIDDTPGLNVPSLRTRARRLKRQHNLGMIVVDYLQLLSGSNRYSSDSRVQEVSEITRGLKILAKELNIPVLALSQLSRQVENREDKRPQLSDLRESGSIEQDADVVMFVYRESYYLERSEPQMSMHQSNSEAFDKRYAQWIERMENSENKADVIISKQRHGPLGTATLSFLPEYTRFGNLIDDNNNSFS